MFNKGVLTGVRTKLPFASVFPPRPPALTSETPTVPGARFGRAARAEPQLCSRCQRDSFISVHILGVNVEAEDRGGYKAQRRSHWWALWAAWTIESPQITDSHHQEDLRNLPGRGSDGMYGGKTWERVDNKYASPGHFRPRPYLHSCLGQLPSIVQQELSDCLVPGLCSALEGQRQSHSPPHVRGSPHREKQARCPKGQGTSTAESQ